MKRGDTMKKTMMALLLMIVLGGILVFLKVNGEQSFEEQRKFNVKQVQSLDINSESWNIVIDTTDTEELIIEMDGKKQKKQSDPVEIEEDGQTLRIIQKDTETGFLKNISMGEKGTIHIAIPNDTVQLMVANNSYGDIHINNLTTESVIISNISGITKVKGLSAKKLDITSKDGEVNLMDSSLGEFTTATTNGDSYINSVSSIHTKIVSTSGEVVLKDIDEEKSLLVETGSGDITVSYKDAPQSLEILATSDSSDITINLKGFNHKDVQEDSKKGTIGEATNRLVLVSKAGIINVK